MPKKPEDSKRPAPSSIRFPDELEVALRAESDATGRSKNAIVVDAVAAYVGRGKRRPSRKVEQALLARLLADTAGVSDQLHEINLSGISHNPLQLEHTLDRQLEIRNAVLMLLGRKP